MRQNKYEINPETGEVRPRGSGDSGGGTNSDGNGCIVILVIIIIIGIIRLL